MKNKSTYNDIKNNLWYDKYMKVAKEESMFETDASGNVWPNKNITRETAAYILWTINNIENS